MRGLLLLTFMLLQGCFRFHETPFGDQLDSDFRDLNTINISAIKSLALTDNFKFAVVTDSHNNAEDFDETIKSINQRTDVDFIVNLGDFVHYGYDFEFDKHLQIIRSATKPFLTVAGNHDLLGNGLGLFKKAFGPINFTIEFADTRIVFFNANSLEMEFLGGEVDWKWLERELTASSTFKQSILAQHLNTDSSEYFSQSRRLWLQELFSSQNLDLILNGHRHKFQTRERADLVLHQTHRVLGGNYSIISFLGSVLTIENCTRGSCSIAFTK